MNKCKENMKKFQNFIDGKLRPAKSEIMAKIKPTEGTRCHKCGVINLSKDEECCGEKTELVEIK